MIVTLACYILLVEPASLQLLGNAAFFGLIGEDECRASALELTLLLQCL